MFAERNLRSQSDQPIQKVADFAIPGFFFGGFECSTQIDQSGRRRNLVAETQHDRFRREDYDGVRNLGLQVIREGLPWNELDRSGSIDEARVVQLCDAVALAGLRSIWDLFHYGYPDDLTPFGSNFQDRFVAYVTSVARVIRRQQGPGAWYTVVNEPSFYAWAGGEVGWFAPHEHGRGYDLKLAIARTAIAGMRAIRAVDPTARFVNADPVCHTVAPHDAPELAADAREFSSYQWQAWDMIGARRWADLDGAPELLDVIGVNYYLTGQWEHRRGGHLAFGDPRRRPFSEMLAEVSERYPGHPIVVAETGCWGDLRVPWLEMISAEVARAMAQGVPVVGICLYPLIDMTEWHAGHWMHFGFWDVEQTGDTLHRRAYGPVHEALRRMRQTYGWG